MNMEYNKLVRDKIPEYIKKKGGQAIFHVADEKEYWLKLKEKLEEEVGEFMESESEEELGDILEVIDAIIEFKDLERDRIEKIKKTKFDERGGFKDRIILEES